ncbi:hypothetical protein [Novacetimonas maltaceti]|uniref:hypothetical protein n=1 Tax=Novacetimonas maltaceti TaxID=1203393 RepID=UPI0011AF3D79|nr:hypothetical protein [Novacetimonas maltaceti]BCZ75978.1 hypothetical protein [Komagataeibacter phage phiKM1]
MKKLLKFVAISFGGIFALLLIIGFLVGDPDKKNGSAPETSSADASTPAPAPVPAAPTISLPPVEAKLIDIVEQKRTAFEAAENDFAKGSTRAQRGKAICAALPNGVANQWIGTVETLSSTSDGKGVLGVRIGPHVTISTHNNNMSDSLEGGSSTLIDPSSSLSGWGTL